LSWAAWAERGNNEGEEGNMRIPLIIAIVLAANPALPQSRSFTGEIMDSPCAAMQSHARMMQGVEARNARECSQKCVRQLGVKYVLFEPSTRTAYQVDDQEKAAAFAGQRVSMKGTYNAATKTIHVESIDGH
jgi:hypothetical protein